MLKPVHFLSLISLIGVGACVTTPISGDYAVPVTAFAETRPVGTANEDAADDPAIWRNPHDPAKSLIVGTDKKAGLYTYDLAGRELSFLGAGELNNVDIIVLTDNRVIVAASDRTDPVKAHILLAELNTGDGTLTQIARVPVGSGEAYGLCAAGPDPDGTISIYSPLKSGAVYRTILAESAGNWEAKSILLHTLASQPEGCVVDPRTATLYVGEENAGIWAFDLDAGTQKLVAPIDNAMLVADVEGLALAPEGENGGYLVASSQGDNTYAVYGLPSMSPIGRIRIAQGAFGSTEETDGIELMTGDFGPNAPAGLFVAQDGLNADKAQNFKLVSWQSIKQALAISQTASDPAKP